MHGENVKLKKKKKTAQFNLGCMGSLYFQSVFLSVLNVPFTVTFSSCDDKSMVGIPNLSRCIIGMANICAACCHAWVKILLNRKW